MKPIKNKIFGMKVLLIVFSLLCLFFSTSCVNADIIQFNTTYEYQCDWNSCDAIMKTKMNSTCTGNQLFFRFEDFDIYQYEIKSMEFCIFKGANIGKPNVTAMQINYFANYSGYEWGRDNHYIGIRDMSIREEGMNWTCVDITNLYYSHLRSNPRYNFTLVVNATSGLSDGSETCSSVEDQIGNIDWMNQTRINVEVDSYNFKGYIRDVSTNDLLNGVTISLSREINNQIIYSEYITNSTGYFEFMGLKSGNWNLSIRRYGYKDLANATLHIESNINTTYYMIPISLETNYVHIVANFLEGGEYPEPLKNEFVVFDYFDGFGGCTSCNELIGIPFYLYTDANGTIDTYLPEGIYHVNKQNYRFRFRIGIDESYEEYVELILNEDQYRIIYYQHLSELSFLEIYVHDEDTGEPIEDVIVSLISEPYYYGRYYREETNSNGLSEFYVKTWDIEDTYYRIIISKAGYFEFPTSMVYDHIGEGYGIDEDGYITYRFKIEDNSTHFFNIILRNVSSIEISGKILDIDTENPIVDATVNFRGGYYWRLNQTDSEGLFRFDNITMDEGLEYNIRVNKSGYIQQVYPRLFNVYDDLELNIYMKNQSLKDNLSLFIVDGNGTSGITCAVEELNYDDYDGYYEGYYKILTTNSIGEKEYQGLSKYTTYSINCYKTGYLDYFNTIEFNDTNVTHTLNMRRRNYTTIIQGHVYFYTGLVPIKNVRVTLSTYLNESVIGYTDNDGYFVIKGVKSGSYTICFNKTLFDEQCESVTLDNKPIDISLTDSDIKKSYPNVNYDSYYLAPTIEDDNILPVTIFITRNQTYPLANSRIYVRNNYFEERGLTNKQGNYVMYLTTGSYLIDIEHEGYKTVHDRYFDIVEGQLVYHFDLELYDSSITSFAEEYVFISLDKAIEYILYFCGFFWFAGTFLFFSIICLTLGIDFLDALYGLAKRLGL